METPNQPKSTFEQLSNQETIDLVTDLIELKDTVKLDGELVNQTKIFKQLQMMLSQQSIIHERIENKIDEVKLTLTRYYDGRLSQAVYKDKPIKFTPSTKSELDKMVTIDPVFARLKAELSESERNLKIIEEGIWQHRQRPKNIATIVSWRKYIETGM